MLESSTSILIDPGSAVAWLHPDGANPVPVLGNCSIGRSPSNNLVLGSEKVSRRHALVHAQEGDEFWLVDLGSRNGSFLNGRRVTQPVQLKDGDELEIGEFRVRFHQRKKRDDFAATNSGETLPEVRISQCWLLLGDIEGSTNFVSARGPAEVAALTGSWLAECKQIVEEAGGSINKFLGDGFFAYWHERERTTLAVARALQALKRLQKARQPPFRLVVHYGEVCSGGGASLGEESLSGPEVNFLFRIEKLASPLSVSCLASKPAAERLMALIAPQELGEHTVSSFPGRFALYQF